MSFLNEARSEYDFVLLYSAAAGLLFILLRLLMLRGLVSAEDLGWQHLHGQLADQDSHYFVRTAWVVIDYLVASWTIIHDDMFYLAGLTILCLSACSLVSWATLRAGITIAYSAIVFTSLLLLSVNVVLAPMYSAPLDYTLLKFSGLTGSITATFLALVPSSFLVAVALTCAVLLGTPCVAFSNFYRANTGTIRRAYCAIVACGLVAIVAVPAPTAIIGLDKLDSRETQNSRLFHAFNNDPIASGDLGLRHNELRGFRGKRYDRIVKRQQSESGRFFAQRLGHRIGVCWG
jgi:hypothetical protein